MTRVSLYVYLSSVFSLVAFSEGRIQAKHISNNGCPSTADIITICVFDPEWNCFSQDQCPDEYKCCPYGCGSECLAVTNPAQHPGFCPVKLTGTGIPCLHDVKCKANEKCCNGYCTVVRPFRVPVVVGEINLIINKLVVVQIKTKNLLDL